MHCLRKRRICQSPTFALCINRFLAKKEEKMEAVKAFNTELASLYDTKPPITKAKMMAISKSAMKAIKLYKHVVLAVEKFIQKVSNYISIIVNNY